MSNNSPKLSVPKCNPSICLHPIGSNISTRFFSRIGYSFWKRYSHKFWNAINCRLRCNSWPKSHALEQFLDIVNSYAVCIVRITQPAKIWLGNHLSLGKWKSVFKSRKLWSVRGPQFLDIRYALWEIHTENEATSPPRCDLRINLEAASMLLNFSLSRVFTLPCLAATFYWKER